MSNKVGVAPPAGPLKSAFGEIEAGEGEAERIVIQQDLMDGEETKVYEEEDMFLETDLNIPYRFVIHPNHRLRQTMDLLVSASLCYMVMVIPFRVCFNVNASGFLLALETIMDIIFVFDLILNFRTAVFYEGLLIYKPKEIAKHYLFGWFAVDFVTTIPLDLIFSAILSESRNFLRIPKLIRLVRVFRLVRLLRFFRLSRLYRKWLARVRINSSVFRLLKLSLVVMTLSHFIACFWFLMAVVQEGEHTWLKEEGLEDAYVFYQYTASFYWAITTITTVGYGDIVVVSSAERVFVTFTVFVGVSTFSYAVGMMSYLVHRMDSDATQDRIDEVNAYMQFRKIPKALMVNIRQHYLFAWRRYQAVMDENHILTELSTNLRQQVATHLKEEVLKENPIFHKTSSEFVTELILRLQPQAAAPGDWICREGQYGNEMYILSNGMVKVCNFDSSIVYKKLAGGSFFGEIALFSEDSLRVASVQCISSCELDLLTKTDIQELLDTFPADREKLNIIDTAQRRLRHIMAVQRRRGNEQKAEEGEKAAEKYHGKRKSTTGSVTSASSRGRTRRQSNSIDISNIFTEKRRASMDESVSLGGYLNDLDSESSSLLRSGEIVVPPKHAPTLHPIPPPSPADRGAGHCPSCNQEIGKKEKKDVVHPGMPVYGRWNHVGEPPTPLTAYIRVMASHAQKRDVKRYLTLPPGCSHELLVTLTSHKLGVNPKDCTKLELVVSLNNGEDEFPAAVTDDEDAHHIQPGDWLLVHSESYA